MIRVIAMASRPLRVPSLLATQAATSLCINVLEHGRAFLARVTDPYRPERHYMRGPGPKWHEKHASEH
jgi:hypothetical protein